MKKKIFSIITAFVMAVALVTAAPLTNSENDGVMAAEDDSISNSNSYSIGMTATGAISENGPSKQYYRFTLSESGKIHITGTAHVQWVYLYLYDSDAEEIWHDHLNWNSTSEVIPIDQNVFLTSGTYYFCVGKDTGEGNYDFEIDFTSSSESFSETEGGLNNSLESASRIECSGIRYNAQIAQNDDKDFWKFTINESGRINLKATFNKFDWVYIKLYDESGQELENDHPNKNSTTNDIVVDDNTYLAAGTYYISVSKDNSCGSYSFGVTFTSSNETYPEVNGGINNSIQKASSLELGNEYKGSIDINDDRDFYSFNVTDGSYTVTLNADTEWLYIKLFDKDGNEVWTEHPRWNDSTNRIAYTKKTTLQNGTYYIVVEKDSVGDYTLKIDSLTQANCPHDEYDSAWHDATYFSKGYREYTCKACGYTYRADYTDKKKLSQVSLYGYYKQKKHAIGLSWYSVSDATGYQIRYGRSKSMSAGVKRKNTRSTSTTLNKLVSKKKYYIQVRAYVKSGNKTAYGPWSKKMVGKAK